MMVACGNQIPQKFSESDELPNIYPDYTNVTIPVNIAPLTFEVDGKVEGLKVTPEERAADVVIVE